MNISTAAWGKQEVEKKSLSPFVGNVGGYSPESQEVQIPSNHDLEDSNSCTSCFSTSFSDAKKSQSSPLPQETIRLAFIIFVNNILVLLIYGGCSIN